ncbi:MAG: emp24/gp25L/p24 family/GOLD [Candidatus Bathyarchaeota archaeon BA2]|nr:MAG: emp24/gp25L/p24 family/GOLD [Candidatus Bathyarchaeota archaeon BA2]
MKETKFRGSITVSGGGNDIDFYITDPNGNTILRYDRATQTSFSFTASTTGTYTMHFDNSFSIISSKSVTLSYSISKAIFGLAPELFYLLVIIIVNCYRSYNSCFCTQKEKTSYLTQ